MAIDDKLTPRQRGCQVKGILMPSRWDRQQTGVATMENGMQFPQRYAVSAGATI